MTDGTNWEVGLGTLTTGAPWTLARTTVYASSNAGALVNFPGPSNVWCDISARQAFSAPTFTNPSITGIAVINSLNLALQSIATAGTTTTLTVSSPYYTIFTGSTTQTCVLPAATTLGVGQKYVIDNNSTGLVTVQTNGGATLWTLASGTEVMVSCLTNGTAAGTWEVDYFACNVATGKVSTTNNTLTFAGTDGTTMTFPTVSSTIPSVGDVIAYALALG
jgi:hypothetical protein